MWHRSTHSGAVWLIAANSLLQVGGVYSKGEDIIGWLWRVWSFNLIVIEGQRSLDRSDWSIHSLKLSSSSFIRPQTADRYYIRQSVFDPRPLSLTKVFKLSFVSFTILWHRLLKIKLFFWSVSSLFIFSEKKKRNPHTTTPSVCLSVKSFYLERVEVSSWSLHHKEVYCPLELWKNQTFNLAQSKPPFMSQIFDTRKGIRTNRVFPYNWNSVRSNVL